MRIGVLGGTFNPIHNAHLLVAEECRDRLSLDKVLFIPSGRPPHKSDDELASAEDRMEMVRRAIEGHDIFEADATEFEREGLTFTRDTLTELRERYPDEELYYIVGRDAYEEMPIWRAPDEIVKLAQLVVVNRPSDTGSPSKTDWYEPILRIQVPDMGISGREIRLRVRLGRSIRFWVPDPVEAYIREKGLYKSDQS